MNRRGLWLALAAACVSGVAVFVNSYGVKEYTDATAYTTAKNLVAALVLVGVYLGVRSRRRDPGRIDARSGLGMLVVAIIGGSVPFVLFFEGLAKASAKDAAFIHKTLVVWVAVLAVAFLRERVGWLQVGAIGALVAGQALLGIKLDALRPGTGELMILGATLMWAVEVVVAKRLLARVPAATLAVARMAGGVVLLGAWLAATGRIAALLPRSGGAWLWVIATGLLLAAYVSCWYSALARARAVDVSAVLVFAVAVTAALDWSVKGSPIVPQLAGLGLVALGTVAFSVLASRPTAAEAA